MPSRMKVQLVQGPSSNKPLATKSILYIRCEIINRHAVDVIGLILNLHAP